MKFFFFSFNFLKLAERPERSLSRGLFNLNSERMQSANDPFYFLKFAKWPKRSPLLDCWFSISRRCTWQFFPQFSFLEFTERPERYLLLRDCLFSTSRGWT